MTGKVAVVGSGFGGLSAAALIASKGFEVTVFEKNSQLGGRATLHLEKGFLFDRGPSWYLMPEVFDRFFESLGHKTGDFLKLKRLDPSYKVFYEGKKPVDVPASPEKVKELFESLEPGGAKKIERYLKEAQYKYDVAMQNFLYTDFTSLTDFLRPGLAVKGLKLRLFESIGGYTKRFFKSPEARKILEYTMVFLGGSPKNTPALYSIMSHVDLTLGVWYPLGGMYEIVKAMEKACLEKGVVFRKSEPVEKIISANGKVKSVVTKKGTFDFDKVVVNADYAYAETSLLEEKDRSYSASYWKKRTLAPSALLFFVGLNKRLPGLAHHNLFLAEKWDRHFSEIFEDKKWPSKPSYYVCCPSRTDAKVAPKGKENLFFLIPVAEGLDDNGGVRERYFKKIIADFESRIGESILGSVEVKKFFSHRDFLREYNASKGTALGLAHTLFQTAFFRPAHKSKKVKNLFYTGHYNHPGIGVPMVIISSHIVSDLVAK